MKVRNSSFSRIGYRQRRHDTAAAQTQRESWTERSIARAIEGFSVFTAGSFVISGFVNAAIFWSKFRMNYFEIAQPSDIVMSGFVYVSFILLITAMVLIPTYFAHLFDVHVFPKYALNLIRLGGSNKKATDNIRRLVSKMELLNRAFKWANVIGALFAGIIVIASVFLKLNFPVGPHGLPPPTPLPFWQQPLSIKPVSHLYLSDGDPQFSSCGHAPVLWMGSSTVLLNCHGRLRVIQIRSR